MSAAAGARGARRQHAVEHVDAGLDHLEDPLGVADAHEVARLLGRQERARASAVVSNISAAVLADREPADRVAVEVELERAPRSSAARSSRSVPPWLIAKASWPGARSAVPLAPRPLGRAAHGLGELAPLDARRRHLVEAHRDVAAEVALDLDGELGREAARGAVVDVAEA